MHKSSPLALLAVSALLVSLPLASPSGAAVGGDVRTAVRPDVPAPSTGAFVLTATSTGASYAPTYTGNGLLGVRVPPAGQGYAGGAVPAQSEFAGFYAQPPGDVQQRANIPTWSTLRFAVGGVQFFPGTGTVRGWRQQIDLHTGVITTWARWTAPDGRVSDLRYDVFTDRAREHVGVVRLQIRPHWSGAATVTDLIDGAPATLTTGVASGRDLARATDWETVRTVGTSIDAGLASHVVGPGSAVAVSSAGPQSVGQRFRLLVVSGHSYVVTKYVGVASALPRAAAVARGQADRAAAMGYAALRSENDAAWAALWRGRIDVLGDPSLATEVNASEFYLWSSTRDGVDWSISPAGLSSNGYDGHIFWDAETWMFPALLAQHPELARGIDEYRYQRLGAAYAYAAATGYKGARFPWESALDGTEQIPPPASVNSEGLYEMHITADIALAQWQYYLATGDRHWLVSRGWPVISGAARFWASKAVRGADGRYHIRHVTGPDEENPDVNDEAYTNVAAMTTLRIAVRAASLVGASAPAAWTRITNGLVVLYDRSAGIHPEFAGYHGQLVKQADVTMMQYPWRYPMPAAVALRDLNYYVPRTDPLGPSMSDAISAIDNATFSTPNCATYVYTLRSIDPFIRDVFDQFSETSTGGAFTFTTGIGGFLQEFLYGYSGLRWDNSAVQIDPSLDRHLAGVVLNGLQWRGRVFSLSVGPSMTRLTLQNGAPMPVVVRGHRYAVAAGSPLTVSTRRPDLLTTASVVHCRPAFASSSQPLGPALAAVDGSPATFWQPASLPASLTVRLGRVRVVGAVSLLWGREWPPSPAPNVPPPPGPVVTLRPTSYEVLSSADGRTWTVVARVHSSSGLRDSVRFRPVSAAFLQVRVLSTSRNVMPKLQELTATRR